MHSCINRELQIVKLNAFSEDNTSLNFFCSYVTNRKQRTKTNLVNLKKLFLIFPKNPFRLLFLIYTYAICCFKQRILILLVIVTTILLLFVMLNWMKFYQNSKLNWINFSSDFKVIISNRTLKDVTY